MINTNEVTNVLLDDGWHDVDEQTFHLGPYGYSVEYEVDDVKESQVLRTGGDSNMPSTGFEFEENGTSVMGPIASILAVKSK